VRAVSMPFIILFKIGKFLCGDIFVFLKTTMLRSKYWEERIFLIFAIVVLGPALWLSIPIVFAILFNQAWLLGLFGTFVFGLVWGFTLYEVNHEGNVYYHKVSIKGQVDWEDVKWGSEVELKKVKKDIAEAYKTDPDYIEGEKEIDRFLKEDSFIQRLKTKIPKKLR
jgi:hypothetical protein